MHCQSVYYPCYLQQLLCSSEHHLMQAMNQYRQSKAQKETHYRSALRGHRELIWESFTLAA